MSKMEIGGNLEKTVEVAPELLTPKEAAAFLRISTKTLWVWVLNGTLPKSCILKYKNGKYLDNNLRVRFIKDEILEAGRRNAHQYLKMMKKQKYLENGATINSQNNLLRGVVLIEGLVILALVCVMVYSRETERTVIVPSYIDRSFYVQGEKASPEYIAMMSKYAVELITQFTPETVKERINEFMTFIEPSAYNAVSTSLLAMADEAVSYRISQYFVRQNMVQEGNTITVSGVLRKYVQDKELSTTGAVYIMKYSINHGRFLINSYEKQEPNQPNQ
jgi:type IV conjugative transfer system protein TraE